MNPEELERRLFGAARSEQPDSDLYDRILDQLEHADADKPRARQGAPVKAWTAYRVAGTAAAVTALAAAVALYLNEAPPERTAPNISADRFVPVPPHELDVKRAPRARDVAPTAPSASTVPSSSTAIPAPPRSAPKAPPRALPEQLALLKEARAALRSGNARSALEKLREYESRPNRVDMSAEKTLLKIEALSRVGQRARAAELAERFVTAHPNDPLVDRARSFTNRAVPEEGVPGEEQGDEAAESETTEPMSEDGKSQQQPDGRVNDEE